MAGVRNESCSAWSQRWKVTHIAGVELARRAVLSIRVDDDDSEARVNAALNECNRALSTAREMQKVAGWFAKRAGEKFRARDRIRCACFLSTFC